MKELHEIPNRVSHFTKTYSTVIIAPNVLGFYSLSKSASAISGNKSFPPCFVMPSTLMLDIFTPEHVILEENEGEKMSFFNMA